MNLIELLNQWAMNWGVFMVGHFKETFFVFLFIVAVWALLHKKLSPHFSYWLFLLVLFKCLLPIQIQLPSAIAQYYPQQVIRVISKITDTRQYQPVLRKFQQNAPIDKKQSIEIEPVLNVQNNSLTVISSPQHNAEPFIPIPHSKSRISCLTWLMFLWAGIVYFLIARLIYVQFSMFQFLKKSKSIDLSSLPLNIKELIDSVRINKSIRMVESSSITTPVVYGYFRPWIVIPIHFFQNYTRNQTEWILLHELAHIRRADTVMVTFQKIVQCLFFFNPALWITNWMADQQREFACDDIALAVSNIPRIDCGEGFLSLAKRSKGKPVLASSFLGAFKSHTIIKKRMMRILDTRRHLIDGLSMKSVLPLIFIMILLIPVVRASNKDLQIDAFNFELEEDAKTTLTGNTIVVSKVVDPATMNVPLHEGNKAFYVEYDTKDDIWCKTFLQFPYSVDVSEMREIHIWLYFFEDSDPHFLGQYRIRFVQSNGKIIGAPDVKSAGTWCEVILPIDRYTSEYDLKKFDFLHLKCMPGTSNAKGKFLIDDIHFVRPASTPQVKDVLVYGFNESEPGTNLVKGWRKVPDDQWSEERSNPVMGDTEVIPTEGSNCAKIMTYSGANRQNSVTLNALEDFDRWDQVVDISVDVRMTPDFPDIYQNFCLVLKSDAGRISCQPCNIANATQEWRTLCWDVDMSPHINAIQNGSDFSITISTHNYISGYPIYMDNFRVGIPAIRSYAERFFSGYCFEGGETYTVTLAAAAEEFARHTVVESIPPGWKVLNISSGGMYVNGKITWDISFGVNGESLWYTVEAPENPTETAVWNGTINGIGTLGVNSLCFINPQQKENMVYAPLLNNKVVLDGVITEDEYDGANTYYFNHETDGQGTPPGIDVDGKNNVIEHAMFKIFHSSQYIYVAIEVTDPDIAYDKSNVMAWWLNDCVSLYLDGNLSRRHTFEDNVLGVMMGVLCDGHVIYDCLAETGQNNAIPIQGNGYWYSTNGAYWNYGARIKEDGTRYVTEYQLDKSKMISPADRDVLGFDIMINSAMTNEYHTNRWAWFFTNDNGVVGDYHLSEYGWGLLKLMK